MVSHVANVLVYENGYHARTMREVAAGVGIKPEPSTTTSPRRSSPPSRAVYHAEQRFRANVADDQLRLATSA